MAEAQPEPGQGLADQPFTDRSPQRFGWGLLRVSDGV
jgi:hypothetical protein